MKTSTLENVSTQRQISLQVTNATPNKPATSAIFCCNQNQAFQLCLNQECRQSPVFTCATQNCQCQESHELCYRGSINKALSIIRQKVGKTEELKVHIQRLFDKIIDQLTDFRDNLVKEVDVKLKYVLLNKVEEKLLKISEKELQCSDINSTETASLWQIIKDKTPGNSEYLEKFKIKLTAFEQNFNQTTLRIEKQITQRMDRFRLIVAKEFELASSIRKASQIFKTTESLQKLIGLIPRKVKKLRLLYQASMNDFSLEKYYNRCGSQTDTIIVGLTNKDKIFGGYSPFCFWTGSQGWVPDLQKKSFLFSLDQNERFQLFKPNESIYRYTAKNQMIQFGGDFYIYDKANTESFCVARCKSHYRSKRFKTDKESYLKLNGNQTQNCTFKEWEVLKVEFEEERGQGCGLNGDNGVDGDSNANANKNEQ